MWMIVTNLQGHYWAFPYDEFKYDLYCNMCCIESVEIVLA
jgi:hypothetical protein